jgi:copper chaperone CopZ
VRKALATLPGVESDSIKVDVTAKEAKFKTSKFDEEAAKKAISDLGYTVSAVKKGDGK